VDSSYELAYNQGTALLDAGELAEAEERLRAAEGESEGEIQPPTDLCSRFLLLEE
jgi:hypothetical protein